MDSRIIASKGESGNRRAGLGPRRPGLTRGVLEDLVLDEAPDRRAVRVQEVFQQEVLGGRGRLGLEFGSLEKGQIVLKCEIAERLNVLCLNCWVMLV